MASSRADFRWIAKVRASAAFFLAGAVAGTGFYFTNLAYVRASREAPPAASAPSALRFLGAPNFNGYCQVTQQGKVKFVSADNAYGWHCSEAKRLGDDPTAVCAWSYGFSIGQVISKVTDFYDPNTWQCWRVTKQLRPPDWNGYCKAMGHGAAYLVSRNVYGWYCDNWSAGIDGEAICEWTNDVSVAVSRFQNFSDQNSWQCWD